MSIMALLLVFYVVIGTVFIYLVIDIPLPESCHIVVYYRKYNEITQPITPCHSKRTRTAYVELDIDGGKPVIRIIFEAASQQGVVRVVALVAF
jgi:hypothetical protein